GADAGSGQGSRQTTFAHTQRHLFMSKEPQATIEQPLTRTPDQPRRVINGVVDQPEVAGMTHQLPFADPKAAAVGFARPHDDPPERGRLSQRPPLPVATRG